MILVFAWLRSMVFTLWMFTSVAIYATVVLIVAPFGHRACFRVAQAWAGQLMWSLKWLCGLDYRVVGAENLPQEASIALLKHSSAMETIVEILLFPRQTWVLKRELMWVPLFGWAMIFLKPIAINRSAGRTAVQQVIRQGRDRLNDGIWVMIFPEGTRVASGVRKKYGVSGAALAGATGRALVPVAHNAGYFWKRRGLIKRPGTVEFVIGKPVFVGDRDPREVNAEIQEWIEAELARMDADYHREKAAKAA